MDQWYANQSSKGYWTMHAFDKSERSKFRIKDFRLRFEERCELDINAAPSVYMSSDSSDVHVTDFWFSTTYDSILTANPTLQALHDAIEFKLCKQSEAGSDTLVATFSGGDPNIAQTLHINSTPIRETGWHVVITVKADLPLMPMRRSSGPTHGGQRIKRHRLLKIYHWVSRIRFGLKVPPAILTGPEMMNADTCWQGCTWAVVHPPQAKLEWTMF